jgi:DNA-binding transcriptional ArsR family regulator
VPDQQLPRREIRDAQTARAMAHPLRIRLMEELAFRGPLTATELAELVGESPANSSWHLRQLAKYGFVEEAGGGTGRQRPWRVVLQSNSVPTEGLDAETAAASQAMITLWLNREFEALRAWQVREASEGEWARAAYVNQSLGWLTLDELRDLGEQMQQIMSRFLNRIGDPASRPPGSRPVRLMSWGIPADHT